MHDLVKSGEIKVVQVSTLDQRADGLTKPLVLVGKIEIAEAAAKAAELAKQKEKMRSAASGGSARYFLDPVSKNIYPEIVRSNV